MLRSILLLVTLLTGLTAQTALAGDLRLVMIEQRGCYYCASWNKDVGPEYPKTSEGQIAPLWRIDIGEIPEDLTLTSRPVVTPTFILVRDGQEISRVEGYHAEDFFWPLLGRMITQAGVDPATGEETGS